MSLDTYRKKRKFQKTPEPKGKVEKEKAKKIFVVQKHEASHLHYDFRLEQDGVLKSWAVPKGPSIDPADKRLAVQVEDHPLEYAKFHGVIPEGNYGAGTVEIWDKGTYETKFQDDSMWEFYLYGKKLKGFFTLVKIKGGNKYGEDKGNNWLLIKKKDEEGDDRSKQMKEMPRSVEPMLATLVDKPFDGDEWSFEIKWDGYRIIAEIEGGEVKLYSRNGKNYTEKFSPVAEELKNLKHNVILDGEIVALDPKGKPVFQYLQNYGSENRGKLVYYLFDILFLDGTDLQNEPLRERKRILEKILPKNSPVIAISETIEKQGVKFFEAAKEQGIEGIMAKKLTSQYRQGKRGGDWLKIKTHLRQEAVICGYTKPRGSRSRFGALVLGVYDRKKLQYVGHTGTGFDEKLLGSLYTKMKPLIRKESPFDNVPKTNEEVTWLAPRLVCEVSFAEWTEEGLMRQPVFKGLREDKKAEDVRVEITEKIGGEKFSPEAPKPEQDEAEMKIGKQRLKVTHLNKIFWPREGYTKGDLISYYRKIAPIILPYLKDRPESLLRYPDGIEGESFYHKDMEEAPDWIEKKVIESETENKKTHYILCQNEETLIYMINLGCIDLNPWNSRVGKTEYPDYMIMDLDPEETSFDNVVKTALAVHEVMDSAGVPNYPKTSGATGIHIYTPLENKYTYEQARDLALLIAAKVNENLPKITSLERSPAKRKGKVYLDCFQNARGQTLATPYSVRAKPGAPVSTPLEWSEVNEKLTPKQFNIKNIFARIDKKGDLFKPVLGKGFDMEKALKKMDSW